MKLTKITTITVVALVFLNILTGRASDTSDSSEARLEAAKRYLAVVPMTEMIDKSINEMAQRIPPDKRDEFSKLMKKFIRVEFLEKLAIESMVKVFTTEELNALADFYGSKIGRSVMNKFGVYMAEIMPAMQQEIMRALQELQQEGKIK